MSVTKFCSESVSFLFYSAGLLSGLSPPPAPPSLFHNCVHISTSKFHFSKRGVYSKDGELFKATHIHPWLTPLFTHFVSSSRYPLYVMGMPK